MIPKLYHMLVALLSKAAIGDKEGTSPASLSWLTRGHWERWPLRDEGRTDGLDNIGEGKMHLSVMACASKK